MTTDKPEDTPAVAGSPGGPVKPVSRRQEPAKSTEGVTAAKTPEPANGENAPEGLPASEDGQSQHDQLVEVPSDVPETYPERVGTYADDLEGLGADGEY
jgi:hypothetical protein